MGFLDKIKKKTKGFLKEDKKTKPQDNDNKEQDSIGKNEIQKQQAKPAKEKIDAVKHKETLKKDEQVKKEEPKVKGIRNIHNIIIKPIITEKTKKLEALGKYSFEIGKSVNKVQVKEAIYKIYGVNPNFINIINKEGKKTRFGRILSKHKDTKQAIVTLKKGEVLDYFKPKYKI